MSGNNLFIVLARFCLLTNKGIHVIILPYSGWSRALFIFGNFACFVCLTQTGQAIFIGVGMKYTIEETERFWRKVEKEKSTVFYFGTRCWEWTAAITKVGYGELTIRQNVLLAHRVSYELAFGEIPRGLLICHNCDNRKCVNPHHLFLGTHKDNTHDMMKKGRHIYITKRKSHFIKFTGRRNT